MFNYQVEKSNKLKLPKNWKKHIELHSNEVLGTDQKEYKIMYGGKRIGYMVVNCANSDNFIQNVFIDIDYRGKGLGYQLYTYALKDLDYIKTNYFDATLAAQGLWRKLCKNYNSDQYFFDGILVVYNQKVCDKG